MFREKNLETFLLRAKVKLNLTIPRKKGNPSNEKTEIPFSCDPNSMTRKRHLKKIKFIQNLFHKDPLSHKRSTRREYRK